MKNAMLDAVKNRRRQGLNIEILVGPSSESPEQQMDVTPLGGGELEEPKGSDLAPTLAKPQDKMAMANEQEMEEMGDEEMAGMTPMQLAKMKAMKKYGR